MNIEKGVEVWTSELEAEHGVKLYTEVDILDPEKYQSDPVEGFAVSILMKKGREYLHNSFVISQRVLDETVNHGFVEWRFKEAALVVIKAYKEQLQ